MLGKNAIRKISIVVNGQIFKNNLEPSGHIALNVNRKLFCLPENRTQSDNSNGSAFKVRLGPLRY